MIEHSVIDIEDTCVNQDENNDDSDKDDIEIIPINDDSEKYDIEIIPINDDSEKDDIENNEIYECVICLEPVTDGSEISKFGCVHAKYMHENCVQTLRKCPLCRERSIIVERNIHPHIIHEYICLQHLICFLIGCGFAAILTTAMYPMVFLNFGNSNYINNTMTNTTLDNYTYY